MAVSGGGWTQVDIVISNTVALIERMEERKNGRERGVWNRIAEHTEDGVDAFVQDVCGREGWERWISQLSECLHGG